MRRPCGDHEVAALVLLSVFFPAFGLLLYYNTQAALRTTTRTHMVGARSTSGVAPMGFRLVRRKVAAPGNNLSDPIAA